MGFKYKNLTTEVAEHAEVRMAKGSRPRVQREKQFHFQHFPEGQNSQGASRKGPLRSLRALRLIFFSSLSEGAETFIISYATRKGGRNSYPPYPGEHHVLPDKFSSHDDERMAGKTNRNDEKAALGQIRTGSNYFYFMMEWAPFQGNSNHADFRPWRKEINQLTE